MYARTIVYIFSYGNYRTMRDLNGPRERSIDACVASYYLYYIGMSRCLTVV